MAKFGLLYYFKKYYYNAVTERSSLIMQLRYKRNDERFVKVQYETSATKLSVIIGNQYTDDALVFLQSLMNVV